jgi:hypothetical protein
MQHDFTRRLVPRAPCSAALGLAVLWCAAAGPGAWAAGTDTDTDDERLTLPEVKLAAAARFDKLDRDGNGALDPAEVEGRISKAQFKAADTDHDGTLNKDEYLALVERLFNRADVHHDGALTVAELRSKSARALQLLIS